MIERARRLIQRLDYTNDQEWQQHWALRNRDHLAKCSCWMCGNPRRYHGEPTVQERRLSDRRRAAAEE
jgi:hypothetical protein